MKTTERPADFKSYIGQESTKRRMEIEIHAAKIQGQQLRHVMFSGPPGLGKTSLSKIVASMFGKSLVETTGPAIKNQKALVNLIKTMEPGGFLLVDEFHKLSQDIQESLLVVLESFEIDEEVVENGKTTLRKTHVPPFTMIAATTRMSNVDHALRERFGIKETLEPYTDAQLGQIVRNFFQKRGFQAWDNDAIHSVAIRSRHTPRKAEEYCNGIISFAVFSSTKCISWALVEDYFSTVNKVDTFGLTETDRRYLRPLLEGPLSLKRWANRVGEKPDEIEQVYEPYYTASDLVQLDSRGRRATQKLFQAFQMVVPTWARPESPKSNELGLN